MATTQISFRWTLLSRVFLAAAIPIIAFTLTVRIYRYSQNLRIIRQYNEHSAALLALSARSYFDAALQAMQTTLNSLDERHPVTANPTLMLQSVLQGTESYQCLLLLDDKGIIRFAATKPAFPLTVAELEQMDLSQQPVFNQARAKQQPVWIAGSPFHLDDSRFISLCRSSDNKSLIGILSLDSLTAILASGATSINATACLLGPNSRQVISRGTAAAARPVAGTLNSTSGIVAEASLGVPGWRLTVTTTQEEVNATLNQLDRELMYQTGLLLVLAFTSAALVSGRTARPLKRLAAAAADTSQPIPTQRFKETEQLAHLIRETLSANKQITQKLLLSGKAMDFALHNITDGKGENFFTNMAEVLATTSQVRTVLVTQWQTGLKPQARVLAAHSRVALGEGYSYELPGNPCALLENQPFVFIPNAVTRRFPDSPMLHLLGADGYLGFPLTRADGSIAGHIALINDREIVLDDQLQNLLQALALRAAAELQRLENLLRMREFSALQQTLALDQTDLICRTSFDGTITLVNETCCRYAGKTAEELTGHSVQQLIAEPDQELLRDVLLHLSVEHPSRCTELRVLDANGEARWHQWKWRIMQDARGRITEYQGTAHDITSEEEIQDALTDARNLFNTFAEQVNSVLWIVDWETQRYTFVSAAFERIWGMPASSIINSVFAGPPGIVPEDRAKITRSFILRAADSPLQEEYRIVRPDGQVLNILDRAFPLRDPDGQVRRIAGIAENITAQKACRAAAGDIH